MISCEVDSVRLWSKLKRKKFSKPTREALCLPLFQKRGKLSLPDRINTYRCLVKKGNKFVLGIITNRNIYEEGHYDKRLATTKDKTKYKYFTECTTIKSKIELDLGSKVKYSLDENWYYVVEDAGKTRDSKTGDFIHEYVIGR